MNSTICSVDCLIVSVTKVRMRHDMLIIAAIHLPSVFIEVSRFHWTVLPRVILNELLAQPGRLVICDDFNCPRTSRVVVQQIDTTHPQEWRTLHGLTAHVEGLVVASDVKVIDVRFSDHRLPISHQHTHFRDLIWFVTLFETFVLSIQWSSPPACKVLIYMFSCWTMMMVSFVSWSSL